MSTLHLVVNPDALAAARAACAPGDELALMHRAADGDAPAGAHVLAGHDAPQALLALVVRHERCVTWR
ncbi:MAG TPA: hypothetical protein VFL14_15505 [Xanthomonadales bacterium]|nr:hypothetical protein [Xanthomonadales bacterium]